jgi:hypothetical protein
MSSLLHVQLAYSGIDGVDVAQKTDDAPAGRSES